MPTSSVSPDLRSPARAGRSAGVASSADSPGASRYQRSIGPGRGAARRAPRFCSRPPDVTSSAKSRTIELNASSDETTASAPRARARSRSSSSRSSRSRIVLAISMARRSPGRGVRPASARRSACSARRSIGVGSRCSVGAACSARPIETKMSPAVETI